MHSHSLVDDTCKQQTGNEPHLLFLLLARMYRVRLIYLQAGHTMSCEQELASENSKEVTGGAALCPDILAP